MAKKSKAGQQRSKEEQWRKRMAAQARSAPAATVSSAAAVQETVETEHAATNGNGATASYEAVKPAAAAIGPGRPRVRPAPSKSPVSSAQKRPAPPPATRGARSRIAVQTMSVDEEMRYVRADIRMLIMLTAACIIVLIVLSFIIK